jgi:hypothetical protein
VDLSELPEAYLSGVVEKRLVSGLVGLEDDGGAVVLLHLGSLNHL